MPPTSARATRRADLDWLRVLAVLLLVPFHSALVFNLDPQRIVYMKDVVQSDTLATMAGFIHLWHMPLLFVIAGAASWYALGRRSALAYLGERVQRLLVPLLFGVLALVPLMVNVHWLGRTGAPSVAQAYARFFTGVTDLTGYDGRFTPAHLWFIMYLFCFSALSLPLLRLLQRPRGLPALAALAAWPGTIYLFAIPLTLGAAVDILGAMNPLYYLLCFLCGYVLAADARFQAAEGRLLPLSTALALTATVGWFALLDRPLTPWTGRWLAGNVLYQLCRWTWVLAILGAGYRWLRRDSPLLRYASEAAYPFYILHLPVDTLVTFYVIRLHASVAVKYTLIVVLTTLISLAVYDLVVKRIGTLRTLFGIKRRAAAPAVSGAQEA